MRAATGQPTERGRREMKNASTVLRLAFLLVAGTSCTGPPLGVVRAFHSLLITFLLSSLIPATAYAQPIVRVAWNTCDGPTALSTQEGREALLQVWVRGQDVGHRGYRFRLELSPAADADLPDAWRFDSVGCQGDSLALIIIRTPQPTPQTCYFGLCEYLTAVPVATWAYDEVTGTLALDVEVLCPPGLANPEPFWRYRIAEIRFLHSARSRIGESKEPGTCGGLDRPVCIRLIEAEYENLDGKWTKWDLGNAFVAASGIGVPVPECDTVPARQSTWGRIKARYAD